MWVFLNDAFLSIVQHNGDSDMLLVRSRTAPDIKRVFPDAKVLVTPGADYRFRATVPRADVAAALQAEVADIDYPNFKNSVQEDDRHNAYGAVWLTMLHYQSRNTKDYETAPAPVQHAAIKHSPTGREQHNQVRKPKY